MSIEHFVSFMGAMGREEGNTRRWSEETEEGGRAPSRLRRQAPKGRLDCRGAGHRSRRGRSHLESARAGARVGRKQGVYDWVCAI